MMCNYVMVDFSFLKRLNEETVARLAFTLQVHRKKKNNIIDTLQFNSISIRKNRLDYTLDAVYKFNVCISMKSIRLLQAY